jgi:hypothetical protein
MDLPRRRGRDVTLTFSRIINVNIFYVKQHERYISNDQTYENDNVVLLVLSPCRLVGR